MKTKQETLRKFYILIILTFNSYFFILFSNRISMIKLYFYFVLYKYFFKIKIKIDYIYFIILFTYI